jgi:Uma2 family endonuclease
VREAIASATCYRLDVHVRARDEDRDPEVIELRRVVFPVEIEKPPGFDPERPSTWPDDDGRLELVQGRLLYMPPTGRDQSHTIVDIVGELAAWATAHPEFTVASNEPGMKLGGDVRAADAAVWRIEDPPHERDRVALVPPLLAIEVAGRDDTEAALREKAAWYLASGVLTVWIVVPATRSIIVLEGDREQRFATGETLPAPIALADLRPRVDACFRQVSRLDAR